MKNKNKISKYMTNKEYWELNESQKQDVNKAIETFEIVHENMLRIRKELRKKFPQSKWLGSSMVRGWGRSTKGFEIKMPFPTTRTLDISIFEIDKNQVVEEIKNMGYEVFGNKIIIFKNKEEKA